MLSHLCGTIEVTRRCTNRLERHAGLHLCVNRVRAVLLMLLFALGLRVPFVAAQGLDPAALLRPATDTWPTYNGDYSGGRFSALDQINAGNIGSLTPAWVFQTHALARSEEHTSELQSH